jgi:SAM-dependent methyltransferase
VSAIAYELGRCVVCGSAEADEITDHEGMRAEVEALWEFQTRRLRPDTPPTRLTDRVAFSQRPPIRIVRCRECGLVYRNPRERDFELRETYAQDEPTAATMRTLYQTQRASFRLQAKRLKQLLGRAGGGLEVGSYVGAFLGAAREEGWHFEGLDIGEKATAFARQQGFTVTLGSLDSWTAKRTFDAVAIWNTFDQLADPKLAASVAHRLVAPGGLFAVRVPNGAFYVNLRKHLRGPLAPIARALLAHNNLLTFPYRHAFTTRSLETLMTKTGFVVEVIHGDSLVLTADRFTRSWAAAEERMIKRAMKLVGGFGKAGAGRAPWLEMYARRR